MKIISPLEIKEKSENKVSIFLGGSIDKETSPDWRKGLTVYLSQQDYQDKLVIFNPRYEDWGKGWHKDPEDEDFRAQAQWEMDHQSKADILIYWFCAERASPITMLEFGIHHKKNPIVGVSKNFGRYGYLVLTCEYHDLPLNHDWDDFVSAIDMRIHNLLSKKSG